MSYIKPSFRHPKRPKNDLGLTIEPYEGSISTLCAGCGHDSITAAITQAVWKSSIEPHRIAKLSGIGCSSKTPTYFLGNAHGFNSVHGRMPSIATGANAANRDLVYIGVSGDGDTASIGMGQFTHVIRRNLNMLYVVENNGCYGLTKGQDSATADEGSLSKKGRANPFESIDLAALAVQLGATFVARSFSGDKEQLVPLIRAALSHRGFALIDIVSPCVTFNNHAGSTKSYEHTRDYAETGVVVDFIPHKSEITAEYDAGTTTTVALHDGSTINLQKAAGKDFDPHSRDEALSALLQSSDEDKILTGLIYIDPDLPEFHDMMATSKAPLNSLDEEVLCPGNEVLQEINASLR